MSVSQDVSRAHVEEEMGEARAWLQRAGLEPHWQPDPLILAVRMSSGVDKEEYIFEFKLDDYRELPPSIELVHPVSGERGTRRCYPSGGNAYFHSQPVVCAPWNRRAYKVLGGPHADWEMKNWASYRPNQSRLGSILALLKILIDEPNLYRGRMER